MCNYVRLIPITILSFLTLFHSCGTTKWISPINQSEEYIWICTSENIEYQFEITDKLEDPHKFYGLFIINRTDSLFVRGFEKGSHHILSYVRIENSDFLKQYDKAGIIMELKDTSEVATYGISLWSRGYFSDTLVSDDHLFEPAVIPNGINLIKTKK